MSRLRRVVAIVLAFLNAWSGPAANAALVACLLYKKRWVKFPAFFALGLSGLVFSLFQVLASSASIHTRYTVYYVDDVVSILLQLAVIVEIMLNVFKPNGKWVPEARRAFFIASVIGAAAAFGASFLLSPASVSHDFLLQLRVDTFTGLVTCEAVIAMMLAASHTGLPWKSHVMAVGQGLMFWALLTVSIEDIGAYFDPQGKSDGIYYARLLIYLVTVAYWTVSLWREEPARKPISPALRKYIVALHDQVQYDLGKVGH